MGYFPGRGRGEVGGGRGVGRSFSSRPRKNNLFKRRKWGDTVSADAG